MFFLRQSTSVDVPIGPFLDDVTGKDAETALTITQPDVRLKKNGGAWAQKNAAQTLSHEENGYYEVTLDATDTNTVGMLRVHVHESGALPVWEDFQVLEEAVYDALYASGAVGPLTAAPGVVAGVVTSGGTTTSIPTSSLTPAAAVTDQFKGRIVIFRGTTTTTNLRGQATDITGSTSGGILTVSALTNAPVSGDVFDIY
jgi:hypothetical protein